MTALLALRDLHAGVAGANIPILHGVSLVVRPGEVHAIMGPNGSGKSTLCRILSGHEGYEVTAGSAEFAGTDLLALEMEERARRGLFIGYQHPVEIPGVSNAEFLRLAVNARRAACGEAELTPEAFAPLLEQALERNGLDAAFGRRDCNAGMSGGQKKRNEMLQLTLLEPRLAILDETDSGLDIDALRIVAEGINGFRREDRAIVLITHFQRLLDLVLPDHVHVMLRGRIVRSGGPDLAAELERSGYEGVAGQ